MTRFIDSFSTQQLLPPWQSRGLRMWSFVIPVERALIQRHLDTHFNAAAPDLAPYRYTALPGATYGLLCVVKHPQFSSLALGVEGWDTVSHTEIYWSYPVTRHRVTADNLLVEPLTVWIQPFAFDNNSYVMFSAREIWGTEMEMATIDLIEGATPGTLRIDMAIEGMAKFDPRARSHQIGCLRIGMEANTSDAGLEALLSDDADLSAFVDQLIGAGIFTSGVDAAGKAARTGMEVNTLRQFRDVFDLDAAAYRAIVASRTVHRNIGAVEFYAGSDTKLEFFWSDALKETWQSMFGLPELKTESLLGTPPPELGGDPTDWSMPSMPVKVALVISYTADADFTIEKTLHTYGQVG